MTLTAFYDLEYSPVSYDYIVWLVRALKERDAQGCTALHVVIVPKEDGLGGFSRQWGSHDEHAARWRLWHIVVASCPLARATVTVAASRAQAQEISRGVGGCAGPIWWPQGKAHFISPLVVAARYGQEIPKLRATEAARRYVAEWLKEEKRPVVTMTLRKQDTVPERNSDAPAWAHCARWLTAYQYRVVPVDDTHVALSAGQGYAALDVDLRLALYERASMNLFGDNGPSALAYLSRASYLRFQCGGDPEHWEKHQALHPGDQLPWATKDQRFIYRPDTFDVMREEFTRWLTG